MTQVEMVVLLQEMGCTLIEERGCTATVRLTSGRYTFEVEPSGAVFITEREEE